MLVDGVCGGLCEVDLRQEEHMEPVLLHILCQLKWFGGSFDILDIPLCDSEGVAVREFDGVCPGVAGGLGWVSE